VPIVRTFAPILAGVGDMKYEKFLTYNIVGGIAWSLILIFAGFILGNTIPSAGKYVTLIASVIIIVSFIPIAFEFLKKK
jgi:membrane-associated protein